MKRFIIFAVLFSFIAAPALAQRRSPQQRESYRAFLNAISICSIDNIKKGIDEGQPLNLITPDEQLDTPLIIAVRNGCLRGAWLLFNAGAKPIPNKYNRESPLNIAMEYSSSANNPADWEYFVSKMLEANANANFQNDDGENALIIAVKYNHSYYVEILLNESNVRIDLTDKLGRTALHWAALYGNADSAHLLLDAGASLTRRDYEGSTPLDIARYSHNSYVEGLMEEYL